MAQKTTFLMLLSWGQDKIASKLQNPFFIFTSVKVIHIYTTF
jgi:hypothetical protein